MRYTFSLAAGVTATALLLTACGGSSSQSSSTTSASPTQSSSTASTFAPIAANALKACLVSGVGGFNDNLMNKAAKEGLENSAKTLGVSVDSHESLEAADVKKNVDVSINDGCTLIFGVGSSVSPDLTAAAQAHSNVEFALIDSAFMGADHAPVSVPNGRSIFFNSSEPAFLAGYLAAASTVTGKIGTFGGTDTPTSKIYMDGFAQGIDKYNATYGSAVTLLGWDKEKKTGTFIGDENSVDKAQNFTKDLLSQGVDVVMPVAGKAAQGTLTAVKEANNSDELKVLWTDVDGAETFGDSHIVTSAEKKIGNTIAATIQASIDGTFSSAPYIGNLKNEGVALSGYHQFDSVIQQKIKDQVETLKADIASGKITVTTPYDNN